MTQILQPFEQLCELNREAYIKLNDIKNPLIVVGGQALGYWLNYYDEIVPPQYRQAVYSVDIDYVAKIADIHKINQEWKAQLEEASIDDHSPSLALILLRDNISHEIKQKDGALFIDVDEYYKNKIAPNLVDFIDMPQGFSYGDINEEAGLILHTIPFVFPQEYELEPHNNLRVLTPIACLKSRLANHKSPSVKPPERERIRIRALMKLIIYYIQEQLEEIGFRKIKKQINLLIEIIASPESINLFVKYDIHLPEILEFFVKNKIVGLPSEFVQLELPQKLEYIQRKITKHSS